MPGVFKLFKNRTAAAVEDVLQDMQTVIVRMHNGETWDDISRPRFHSCCGLAAKCLRPTQACVNGPLADLDLYCRKHRQADLQVATAAKQVLSHPLEDLEDALGTPQSTASSVPWQGTGEQPCIVM